MERIDKTVFISYRRTNTSWAIAVFQNLKQNGYDVFFDYNGIASGDFERVILANIKASAHFLVLLTPSALERCQNPKDWLRLEVEAALEHRRNIVPLVFEGFDFQTPTIASQLTGKLASLKHYNALRIPPDYFDEAMERLRGRYLNIPLTAVLHPLPVSAQQTTTEQKVAAGAAPAVQRNELTAQQWFEWGYGATDVDEQIRFYTEAIRLHPDHAFAFNNRGNARYRKGDHEGGMKDFNEAIRLQPANAIAFNNRGLARDKKGDHEGGMKDFNEAIRLQPNYPEAFFRRGNAREKKGDHEGAIQDYTEAIRLQPDFAEAFNNRGNARFAKGDHEGANEDFRKAEALKAVAGV